VAAFTHINLREVEDQASKFGLSPGLEGRFATKDLGLDKAGVSYQRLAPGFRVPFGHKHAKQEELYVVVDGSARLKLDDEILDLEQWDAVRVEPELMRCFEGGPEGATILAFGAPHTGPSAAPDVAMTPNWWRD
jgi:hypothetical protein